MLLKVISEVLQDVLDTAGRDVSLTLSFLTLAELFPAYDELNVLLRQSKYAHEKEDSLTHNNAGVGITSPRLEDTQHCGDSGHCCFYDGAVLSYKPKLVSSAWALL